MQEVGFPGFGPVCFGPAPPQKVDLVVPVLHHQDYQPMFGDLVARDRGELRQSLESKLFQVFTVRAESQREKKASLYNESRHIKGQRNLMTQYSALEYQSSDRYTLLFFSSIYFFL